MAASLESELELGRHVYSTYLEIPPRARCVVVLHVRGLLAGGGAAGADGGPYRYRLDLHAQPLVQPDRVTVAVVGGPPEQLVLDRDRTVRVPVG